MNDHVFGMFDMGLVGLVVVAFGAWQLWSINREIAKDKKPPADAPPSDTPPSDTPPSDIPGG